MFSPCERVRKLFIWLLIFAFISNQFVWTPKSYAQSVPAPSLINTSLPFTPPLVSGMTLYPDNPLKFDFIIDTGDDNLQGEALQKESQKLINYFLASLTTPEKEMWVNLSPTEKDRIIADGLSKTEMGRDMLLQDYLLKQLTASLMSPQQDLGKAFWEKIYSQAQEKFGTTDIPTDTFSKVWIVPDEAMVYIHDKSVFVVKSHLKVMLEDGTSQQELIREIILPAIEKEVNTGKNFANLRQIYNSMILATWYKKNLKENLLNKIYIDQNKTRGIDVSDPQMKEKIYNQYLSAFKSGVYDTIKEEYDAVTQEVVTRKYFTGGVKGLDAGTLAQGQPSDDWVALQSQRPHVRVAFEGNPVTDQTSDPASLTGIPIEFRIDGVLGKNYPVDMLIMPNKQSRKVVVVAHGVGGSKEGGVGQIISEMKGIDASVVRFTTSRYAYDLASQFEMGLRAMWKDKTFNQDLEDNRRVIRHILGHAQELFGFPADQIELTLVGISLGGIKSILLAPEFPQVKHLVVVNAGIFFNDLPDLPLLKNLPSEIQLQKALTKFDHPVVIHGEEDNFAPMEAAQALAGLAARGRFVSIEGMGHMLGITTPEKSVELFSNELRAIVNGDSASLARVENVKGAITASDEFILQAIAELKAEGGPISQKLIAGRAGVKDDTVRVRKKANPVIRKAVDQAIILPSEIDILQAIKALKSEGKEVTNQNVALRAGYDESTVINRRKYNSRIRNAFNNARPLSTDEKILKAVAELAKSNKPMKRFAIADKAGLNPFSVSRRSRLNPVVKEAIQSARLQSTDAAELSVRTYLKKTKKTDDRIIRIVLVLLKNFLEQRYQYYQGDQILDRFGRLLILADGPDPYLSAKELLAKDPDLAGSNTEVVLNLMRSLRFKDIQREEKPAIVINLKAAFKFIHFGADGAMLTVLQNLEKKHGFTVRQIDDTDDPDNKFWMAELSDIGRVHDLPYKRSISIFYDPKSGKTRFEHQQGDPKDLFFSRYVLEWDRGKLKMNWDGEKKLSAEVESIYNPFKTFLMDDDGGEKYPLVVLNDLAWEALTRQDGGALYTLGGEIVEVRKASEHISQPKSREQIRDLAIVFAKNNFGKKFIISSSLARLLTNSVYGQEGLSPYGYWELADETDWSKTAVPRDEIIFSHIWRSGDQEFVNTLHLDVSSFVKFVGRVYDYEPRAAQLLLQASPDRWDDTPDSSDAAELSGRKLIPIQVIKDLFVRLGGDEAKYPHKLGLLLDRERMLVIRAEWSVDGKIELFLTKNDDIHSNDKNIIVMKRFLFDFLRETYPAYELDTKSYADGFMFTLIPQSLPSLTPSSLGSAIYSKIPTDKRRKVVRSTGNNWRSMQLFFPTSHDDRGDSHAIILEWGIQGEIIIRFDSDLFEEDKVVFMRTFEAAIPEDYAYEFVGHREKIIIKKRDAASLTENPGGIDFDASHMNLQEQGQKIEFDFDPNVLKGIAPENIQGIAPVIINITPITNFPLLLGLASKEPISLSRN